MFKSSLTMNHYYRFAACLGLMLLSFSAAPLSAAEWSSHRANNENTTNAKDETEITVDTLRERGLKEDWVYRDESLDNGTELLNRFTHGPTVKGDRVMSTRYNYDNFVLGLSERDTGRFCVHDAVTGLCLDDVDVPFEISPLLDGIDPSQPAQLVETFRGPPTIVGDRLLFGTHGFAHQLHLNGPDPYTNSLLGFNYKSGAYVVSLKANPSDPDDYQFEWGTLVDAHPSATVRFAPSVQDNIAFVSVGGGFEYEINWAGSDPGGTLGFLGGIGDRRECCNFRGSILALDLDTGEVLWKTYLTPPKPGEENYDGISPGQLNAPAGLATERSTDWFSGAGVWAGKPAVDTERGLIYVATSNSFSLPEVAHLCEKKRLGIASSVDLDLLDTQLDERSDEMGQKVNCTGRGLALSIYDAFRPNINGSGHKSFGHYGSSIVALDMHSGDVVWSYRAVDHDAFFPECFDEVSDPAGQCGPSLKAIIDYKFHERVALNPTNPEPHQLNSDFAQAPMIVENSKGRTLVVAGNKAGTVYAIDADRALFKSRIRSIIEKFKSFRDEDEDEDGWVYDLELSDRVLAWKVQNGRGGSWGSNRYSASSDGKRVYVSDSQSDNFGFELLGVERLPGALEHRMCHRLDDETQTIPDCAVGEGSEASSTHGYISAIDAKTGKIVWEFAPPVTQEGPIQGGIIGASGTVTGSGDGVLIFGTLEYPSMLYALEAKTGNLLWTYSNDDPADNMIFANPTIVDGAMYQSLGGPNAPAAASPGFQSSGFGGLKRFVLCDEADLGNVPGCAAAE